MVFAVEVRSSHAVLSKPPLKSASECSLDLLLCPSHTLPDYERFRSFSCGDIFISRLVLERCFEAHARL